jgi:hypothetical protein
MIAPILISLFLTADWTDWVKDPEYYLQTYEIAGYDSVSLGQFTGIMNYRYYRDRKIDFFLRIMDGENIIDEIADYEISLYKFPRDDNGEEYARDINGDGTKEFILHRNGGGQQGYDHIIVYSLGDKPILRDAVSCGSPSVRLLDIDADEIPEIYCGDYHFMGWKAHPSESAGLRLIWKWDGAQFRLANFKFTDYLLNIMQDRWERMYYEIPLPDTLEGIRYDPDSDEPDFPPVQLWGTMLVFIYAGQADKADSVFHEYWPEEIAGKEEFYRDFRRHLERSGHWQQLLESDW